jgi:CBS domain-containing protein
MVALVKDYMIQKKEIVSPDDSVQSAIELMVENDMGSVIVRDMDERVVGIFTERDVLRHCLVKQSKFLYLNISEVMSTPVLTVSPETTITQVMKIMNEKNVRRLPVVDDQQKLIGFVSWKELFEKLPTENL